MAMSMRRRQVSHALGSTPVPTLLPKLAGRVPQRWRRRVPMRLRNAIVARLGHPGGAVRSGGASGAAEPRLRLRQARGLPQRRPPRLPRPRPRRRRALAARAAVGPLHARSSPRTCSSTSSAPTARSRSRSGGGWRRPGRRCACASPTCRRCCAGCESRTTPTISGASCTTCSARRPTTATSTSAATPSCCCATSSSARASATSRWSCTTAGCGRSSATAGGSPLGLVWGPGFHPREPDAGPRWAAASAELCVCLGGERPEEVALTLALSRHADADTALQITGAGLEQRIELAELPTEHSLAARAAARRDAPHPDARRAGRPTTAARSPSEPR